MLHKLSFGVFEWFKFNILKFDIFYITSFFLQATPISDTSHRKAMTATE